MDCPHCHRWIAYDDIERERDEAVRLLRNLVELYPDREVVAEALEFLAKRSQEGDSE